MHDALAGPPISTARSGRLGEAIAAHYLESLGFRIVVANFTVPVGRNRTGAAVTGEIDIVALDGETLCFVEVKTRESEELVAATRSIDRRKQRQIIRTARAYRRIFGVSEIEVRYDAVAVIAPGSPHRTVRLERGMFNESEFKKRRWAAAEDNIGEI